MLDLENYIKSTYANCRIMDIDEGERAFYCRFIYESTIFTAIRVKYSKQVTIYKLEESKDYE